MISRNVDLIAVSVLLLAAALFGGVRDLVVSGLHGSGQILRVERDGRRIFTRPLPPLPPMHRLPRLQRD